MNGNAVTINSGHAYDREHVSGDVRDTGLSRDTIENAILDDLSDVISNNGLTSRPRDIPINIEGHEITYRVLQLPDGRIIISDYFPTP